jgi:hypothetical protein
MGADIKVEANFLSIMGDYLVDCPWVQGLIKVAWVLVDSSTLYTLLKLLHRLGGGPFGPLSRLFL